MIRTNVNWSSSSRILCVLLLITLLCYVKAEKPVLTVESQHNHHDEEVKPITTTTATNTLTTDTSVNSAASVQSHSSSSTSKVKLLFSQYWSPLKAGSQPHIDDMHGFEFVLTERTGQRKSYNGVLQIHASSTPQWVNVDVFAGQVSYHLNVLRKTASFKVIQNTSKFCFSLNFIPRNNTLLAKVAQFATSLLAGQQTTYRFSQNSVKYDALINQLCNNASLKMDAFVLGDDGFVSCAPAVSSSSVAVKPQFFITRNVLIKVTKQIEGKARQLAKRCLSLEKFDRQLAISLGDRYFAELLQDTVDNRETITAAFPRPTFWFESSAEACEFPYMADSSKCNSRNTQPGTKVCIFVHGAGGVKDQAPKYNSFKDYWGDIEQWTPQCSKRVFAVRNTRDVGWDDRNLQKYYCDLAVRESGLNHTLNGVPQVKNVVLFAHSQGGLVISAALKNKLCAFHSSSSWYSVSTPFDGSDVVEKLIKYCAAYSKGPFNPLNKDYVFGYLAAKYGYCNQKTGLPYPGYMSLAPNYVAKDGTTTSSAMNNFLVARNIKPNGRMCGTSPTGLLSRYSFVLTLLVDATQTEQPNDGFVESSSCTKHSSQSSYSASFSSNHYLANLNHADTSCRNGNGWFSRSKQPCLYYKDKV
ncbi:hypothetical protein C9374_001390 [Naegleria lovaniensis]|uniref:DUF676 domain-containing protein n=1 Tax=Naegleria lovaniensis TaxID=51637 RepID=A0AA88GSY5_NAELO|nr:uncharacterized protein C9374_001390 [Naegleria lovaniensis]KAG2387796.1 hypothetical protein C9374_001390 [Naegleria lovaniensis]